MLLSKSPPVTFLSRADLRRRNFMMTLDDYIEQAKQCAVDYKNGDERGIELLAKIAYESEQAKQKLRELGFGWTGLSLPRTVDQIKDPRLDAEPLFTTSRKR